MDQVKSDIILREFCLLLAVIPDRGVSKATCRACVYVRQNDDARCEASFTYKSEISWSSLDHNTFPLKQVRVCNGKETAYSVC